jgi:hypothetical protein
MSRREEDIEYSGCRFEICQHFGSIPIKNIDFQFVEMRAQPSTECSSDVRAWGRKRKGVMHVAMGAEMEGIAKKKESNN